MIGRQTITVNRAFTLEELEQFMQENWDKENFSNFTVGRPTAISLEEYILLPATERFMVAVYPKAAGGLFSKENKVVLITADTPASAQASFFEYFPVKGTIFNLWQSSRVMSAEKERKGPAEEVLLAYTEHMRDILTKNGLLA